MPHPRQTRSNARKSSSSTTTSHDCDLPPSSFSSDICIGTWNQQKRFSDSSAIDLALTHNMDILAIQEPNPQLADSSTHHHHPRGGFMKWYNYTTFFYCSTIFFNRIWLFNACIWEKHIFNAKFTFCEKGPDLSMQSTRSKSFLKCRYHQKDWHINKYIPF